MGIKQRPFRRRRTTEVYLNETNTTQHNTTKQNKDGRYDFER